MELVLERTPHSFLQKLAQEISYQEETSETIVPDSFPDIGEIADCFATPILRGKDCRDGTIVITGGVKAAILYHPETEEPLKKLDLYVPFSMRFENKAFTPETQVIADLKIRSLDATIVNSRKAILRLDIGCEMTAYIPAVWENTMPKNYPEQLQLKKAVYPVYLPLEAGEKSFVVSDSLENADRLQMNSDICKLDYRMDITDQKLIANKAVFKGNLHCRFLYMGEGELLLHEQTFPFSQYCELKNEYEEETVSICCAVTGYDLEENMLNIHILAQCIVHGMKTFEVIEDAYCTKDTLNCTWNTQNIETIIDKSEIPVSIRLPNNGHLKRIQHISVYSDFPKYSNQDEVLTIVVPITADILGTDENGIVRSAVCKSEGTYSLPVNSKIRCHAFGRNAQFPQITGSEIRFDCNLEAAFYSPLTLKTMDDISVESREEADSDPSLILCRVSDHESLWDVAKRYHSTEKMILDANHLDSDEISVDKFLLIPVF